MSRRRIQFGAACLAAGLWLAGAAAGADEPVERGRSLADRRVEWPTVEQWRRVLLMEDYNTRVVVLGAALLGGAAGMVGSFTLLRKRALMGDALSHATLPGIALAFLAATVLGADGKSLPLLLAGATATGLLGVGAILALRNLTRLKEDAALGAVLSVFFGAGVALLGVIQQMEQGHAAGLEAFIYGKTASMGARDALVIAFAALAALVACVVGFKEFKLLCFDEDFAAASGLPVVWLDGALMALVVLVTIVGLQAVGLVLMIALLVMPAAAARFWTDEMRGLVLIAAALGAAGGALGAALSALFSRLPSGATIVLVCSAGFVVSMVFGSARGVLVRLLRRSRLNRAVDRQHLLRDAFELLESSGRAGGEPAEHRDSVAVADLLAHRSWSPRRLARALRRAERDGLVTPAAAGFRLTARGLVEARRLTRQHRLWELYLIAHAEVAPGRVDREADAIEHVLEPEIVAELEAMLAAADAGLPASPHEPAAGPPPGAARPSIAGA